MMANFHSAVVCQFNSIIFSDHNLFVAQNDFRTSHLSHGAYRIVRNSTSRSPGCFGAAHSSAPGSLESKSLLWTLSDTALILLGTTNLCAPHPNRFRWQPFLHNRYPRHLMDKITVRAKVTQYVYYFHAKDSNCFFVHLFPSPSTSNFILNKQNLRLSAYCGSYPSLTQVDSYFVSNFAEKVINSKIPVMAHFAFWLRCGDSSRIEFSRT